MKVISGQRGCGKSVKLIKYAYENDITIVCKNPQHHLLLARELEIPFGAVRFITYQEFDKEKRAGHSYLIDDIELYLMNKSVVGYTMTVD
jgi:hypothetical protein